MGARKRRELREDRSTGVRFSGLAVWSRRQTPAQRYRISHLEDADAYQNTSLILIAKPTKGGSHRRSPTLNQAGVRIRPQWHIRDRDSYTSRRLAMTRVLMSHASLDESTRYLCTITNWGCGPSDVLSNIMCICTITLSRVSATQRRRSWNADHIPDEVLYRFTRTV